MIIAAAPAAATDISADWSDNSGISTTKVLKPANSSSLVYTITSTSTNDIELELIIENAENSNYGVGFNLTYPKEYVGTEDNYFAKVLSHSYTYNSGTGKGTLKMVLEPNASVFDLNIIVGADASKVYHNETANITAKITQDGTDKQADVVKVKVTYDPITSSASYILNNPSRLPTGENEVDIGLYYNPSISALTVAGFRLKADSVTFNFSNVTVYADGFTGNLSQWKSHNGGTDILTFEPLSNASYDIIVNDYEVTFKPKSGQFTLGGAFYLPLKIKTDANFTDTVSNPTAPSINFTNVTFSAVNMTYNGRGPAFTTFVSGSSPDGSSYGWSKGGTAFTAVRFADDPLSVSLRAPTGSDSINNRNIINSKTGVFEYQNLFKVQITNNVPNGSTEIIDFNIPSGLNITHIRVPQYSNEQTKYTAVSIWDRANSTFVLLSPSTTTNLTQYGYSDGENITLKIENVIRMYPSPSAASSESATHMITFIGQITNTETTPTSFTFNASRNGSGDPVSNNLPITVRDSYIIMPHITYNNGFLTDSTTSYSGTPSLVQRGDTFYMFTTFQPSTYPYNSVLRFDPMNPTTTAAMSNPVVYFNIPKGLIPGEPVVTNSGGNPIDYKTYPDSQVLEMSTRTFLNEGIYASEGGSVIEVKFNIDGSNSGTFWTQGATVRLPVTVSDDFDETGFTFEPNSVLVSTWDPNAYDVIISGSNGRTQNLSNIFSAENFSQIAASVNGSTYAQYIYRSSVEVASDASVSAGTSIRMSTGYISYKSGTTTTYPELHAGSQNEEFKISFKNKLSASADNASVYFVLPSNDEWAPKLLSPGLGDTDLNISLSGSLSRNDIAVYYTTEELGNGNTLTEMSGLSTWAEINSTSLHTIDWENVTAIRCDVLNAPGNSGFDLYLKFYMPDLKVADLNEGDKLVLGQTLYDININGFDPISSETGATAAIKIKPSLAPQIVDISGSSFVTSGEVEFRTDVVPGEFYDGFIVRDDISDVKLDQIIVQYKAPGSTEFITQSQYSYNSGNLSDAVTSSVYSDTVNNQDWKGYQYTLKTDFKNYIINMNQTLGEYSVTLISTLDNDLNSNSTTYLIKVLKNESNVTLTLNDNNVGYDMDSSNTLPLTLPDGLISTPGSYTWTDYLTHYVNVADYGDSHTPARFVKAESSTFENITEPGKFYMNYTYNSPGLTNDKTVSVPVTVILYDNLTVQAKANGESLDMLDLYVDDNVLNVIKLDYDDSGYPTVVKGTSGNPTVADYKIYYANFPDGVKDSNSGVLETVTSGSVPAGDYLTLSYSVKWGESSGNQQYTRLRTLNFDPVTIYANTTGMNDAITSVRLYSVNNTPVAEGDDLIEQIFQDDSGITSFIFDKGAGEKWFDDGDYYVVVSLTPGYLINSAGFTQDSEDSLIWIADVETLNHEDLSFDFEVVKGPFISGIAWEDTNKNSFIDIGENILSGVEIELYDDTGVLIDYVNTQEDGYYCFYGMPEDTYYIKVKTASGYLLSDYNDGLADQTVDKNNQNCSVEFEINSSNIWQEGMNIGLYKESGKGGSGYGQAYVVTSSSGGTILVEGPDGEIREPGYAAPLPEIETAFSFPWYILIAIIILIVAGIVCISAIKKYRGRA